MKNEFVAENGRQLPGFLTAKKRIPEMRELNCPKLKMGLRGQMIKISQTTFQELRRLTWSVSSFSLSISRFPSHADLRLLLCNVEIYEL